MNKIISFTLFLSLAISLFPQDWQKGNFIYAKQDGNIFYGVDTMISITARNSIIDETKGYIKRNLDLLHETEFDERCGIVILHDRGKMHKRFKKRVSSFSHLKDSANQANLIVAIYDQQHCPLNRELMKTIVSSKWGEQKDQHLTWLKEGLAAYATPKADGCDGSGIGEKYAYLMQHEKLTDLTLFPGEEITADYKVARIQSAYVVEYLLENYGIEKLKRLWQDGMADFEQIYGLDFNTLATDINKQLKRKYNMPVHAGWEAFTRDCIDPQPDDWLPVYTFSHIALEGMLTKDMDKIKFMITPTIDVDKRNGATLKTKEYITQNLALINESEFNDSLLIVLVKDRSEMEKYFGHKRGGNALRFKDEEILPLRILSVFGGKYSPLKHELMHMINMCKWGDEPAIQPQWLVEGLAVFANPETYDCDGHTIEERYIYFLQTGKLLPTEILIQFLKFEQTHNIHIGYNQSAYLVSVLYEKYGIEKIKELWQNGMKDFEKIYGITFEKTIENINKELNKKYPDPIDFNWEIFEKSCIE